MQRYYKKMDEQEAPLRFPFSIVFWAWLCNSSSILSITSKPAKYALHATSSLIRIAASFGTGTCTSPPIFSRTPSRRRSLLSKRQSRTELSLIERKRSFLTYERNTPSCSGRRELFL